MFSIAQKTWLQLLLAAWAALLFGGFILGRPDREQSRRMPVWTLMASSLALVLAGWSWWWLVRTAPPPVPSFALLIALGMSCGLVGDLIMARLIPVRQHTLGGMGAFGAGHIAYVSGFLVYAVQSGAVARPAFWVAWVAWLAAGAAGWYIAVYRGQRPTVLHWAALPYALLLASTAGVATGIAIVAGGFVGLSLGTALFLLSDLILAANLFNGTFFRLIHDVVWLTYGPGQMLIVYSIGQAVR
jgi:hypothetical protein